MTTSFILNSSLSSCLHESDFEQLQFVDGKSRLTGTVELFLGCAVPTRFVWLPLFCSEAFIEALQLMYLLLSLACMAFDMALSSDLRLD